MSVETLNKTQEFLNEVFPEFKNSESYIPELLLERIRKLEKRDEENQKMFDMMMNICENTVTQLNNKIIEQTKIIEEQSTKIKKLKKNMIVKEEQYLENIEKVNGKATLTSKLLDGLLIRLCEKNIIPYHEGEKNSFFSNRADYIWNNNKDTLIRLYYNNCNYVISMIEILKYIFVDSSFEDLEYFITKGSELLLLKYDTFYKDRKDKEEYCKIKFLLGMPWYLETTEALQEHQDIILRKFKRVFDTIIIDGDKWGLFGENIEVQKFVKKLRML